ncbi:YadA C-terminal domain-containing protein [Leclercia adecarboxylata]|uniref:YadA C-terminal domain-containing protein n=1 Tax=Leclercia adecarboxylata TaxID=83655 RepID=UPI00202A1F18|nr:YadA-like family protein [Leclercia adecarboxylata]URO00969.1 YadA C-terminal domain-containing protein [Leclercia adecarboxylata]
MKPTPVAAPAIINPQPQPQAPQLKPTPVAAPAIINPQPQPQAPQLKPTPVAAPAIINPQPQPQAPQLKPTPVAAPAIINPQPQPQAPQLKPTLVAAPAIINPQPQPQAPQPQPTVNAPAPQPQPLTQVPQQAPTLTNPQPHVQPNYQAVATVNNAPDTLQAAPAPQIGSSVTVANDAAKPVSQVVTVTKTAIAKASSGTTGSAGTSQVVNNTTNNYVATDNSQVSSYYISSLNAVNGRIDTVNAHIAQNKTAQVQTNQRVAENSRQLANHERRISELETKNNAHFKSLKGQIDDNKRSADAGIAGVAAMSNIPQVTESQKFNIGAGVGARGDEQAMAIGFSTRASDSMVLKGSVAADTNSEWTVGAGIALGW